MFYGSKAAALKWITFLKMKQDVKVKVRGCADGMYQQVYTHKDESISPIVYTKSLMISCVIDAMEWRAVATMDIPGDLLQSDTEKLVYI